MWLRRAVRSCFARSSRVVPVSSLKSMMLGPRGPAEPALPGVGGQSVTTANAPYRGCSLELRGCRKRLARVDHEHHELIEIARARAEDLHRHARTVSVHGLARIRIADAMRCLLTEPARQHVEGLGS